MADDNKQKTSLRRRVGLFGLTAYGVGTILGAGIYALIGEAAGMAGGGLWASFLLSAGIALLTGLSYSELATMFPLAGAEYNYVQQAFQRRPLSFLVGWTLVISAAASAATVSLGFAGYLQEFIPAPLLVSALLLIGLLSIVNFIGIRESTIFNIVFTLIEAGGLVMVIIVGFLFAGVSLPPAPPTSLGGVVQAAAFIFFAYIGFEEIANVTEETRNPTRTVPLAIGIAVAVSALLYAGVAVAVLRLSTPADLAASSAPLSTAVSTAMGSRGGLVISIISLFATANTVLLVLVANSRMIFGMARGRSLPAFLARIHPITGTPWMAIIALMVLSWLFLPIGSIGVVGSIASWAALVAFAAVNGSLVWLRYAQPDHSRPFRVPVNIGRFPVLPALGLLSALAAASQLDFTVTIAGLTVLATGLAVYFVLSRLP